MQHRMLNSGEEGASGASKLSSGSSSRKVQALFEAEIGQSRLGSKEDETRLNSPCPYYPPRALTYSCHVSAISRADDLRELACNMVRSASVSLGWQLTALA